MIISKINTEIETFCMDSDFRQSYPLIVFWGRGYDLDTQPCLFGSPDKPGGLSIQLCKSEKKEFYIRYSS